MENNDVMFGDRSLDEWANMYQTQEETNLSDDQAEKMGILRAEPENTSQPSENELYETPNKLDAENPSQSSVNEASDKLDTQHPDENKGYKKLSVGGTIGDIGKTVGSEALRFVAPQEGSKIANAIGWSEEDLYQHQSETRIGRFSKSLYRWGMFLFGLGKFGAGIKTIGVIQNAPAAIKLGTGISKLWELKN